jgi:tetratricopeptide (TPR) repeat protein
MSGSMIEEGWAALHAGDADAARDRFERALQHAESGAAREGLGQAIYLQRDYTGAIAQQERAYAAYRRERKAFAAARAARNLAWITGNVLGDWAVHNGWLARARRILEEVAEDGPERGWVLIIKSYTEPDAEKRQDLCHQAIAIGRRFADPNIEMDALATLGALHLMMGRTDEGLALLDESMAALCAGELTEIATMDKPLLRALLGLRAGQRCLKGRPMDACIVGRHGQPERGCRILPRPLRRHSDRCRTLAGG